MITGEETKKLKEEHVPLDGLKAATGVELFPPNFCYKFVVTFCACTTLYLCTLPESVS